MGDQTSASFVRESSGNKQFSNSEIDQNLMDIEERINQKLHNFMKTLLAMRRQEEDMKWSYMEIQVSEKRYYELDACNRFIRPFSDEEAYYLVIDVFQEEKGKPRIYPIRDRAGKVCHVLNGYGKRGWEVYDYNASENRFYLRRKFPDLELKYYRFLISDDEINSLFENSDTSGAC